MSYSFDSSTGNIVDEEDGQIVATTADRSTTDQGALLAASKDLFRALKTMMANGHESSSIELAQDAIAKATAFKDSEGHPKKHFQHAYRVVLRMNASTQLHTSIDFQANHHDHAKKLVKASWPDCVIMNIVRF